MTKKVGPREVPCRDDFYMGLAFWISAKSKDPNTQMGSVIVNCDGSPQGYGYNGPPKQINDNIIDWDRSFKYDVVLHAESNAIDHSCGDLNGSILYVTGKPCKACMLKIIKHGIKKVVYFNYVPEDSSSMFANEKDLEKTEELAKLGGVTLVPFAGNLNWMRDRMKTMESLGIF